MLGIVVVVDPPGDLVGGEDAECRVRVLVPRPKKLPPLLVPPSKQDRDISGARGSESDGRRRVEGPTELALPISVARLILKRIPFRRPLARGQATRRVTFLPQHPLCRSPPYRAIVAARGPVAER